ncbi:MAG: hypothetical protein ACREEW_14440 [Caulobacteraceae bacterium]
MLVLSTGNLTRLTMTRIHTQKGRVLDDVYGVIIHVGSDNPPEIDLAAAFDLARRYGCNWINFDRDAAPHPDLRSWNW